MVIRDVLPFDMLIYKQRSYTNNISGLSQFIYV